MGLEIATAFAARLPLFARPLLFYAFLLLLPCMTLIPNAGR